MKRRARLIGVLALLLAGAIGIISSTQTWIFVTLIGGDHALPVPGADALPLLAPLSLAALALGAALSITGMVLRYVFGALAVAIGVWLAVLTVRIMGGPPTSAVSSTVTETTGITGDAAVAALVESTALTGWVYVDLVAWFVLAVGGVFVLATARSWRGSGRRYRTDAAAHAPSTDEAAPLDAIDSWDDLSRGDDPTR